MTQTCTKRRLVWEQRGRGATLLFLLVYRLFSIQIPRKGHFFNGVPTSFYNSYRWYLFNLSLIKRAYLVLSIFTVHCSPYGLSLFTLFTIWTSWMASVTLPWPCNIQPGNLRLNSLASCPGLRIILPGCMLEDEFIHGIKYGEIYRILQLFLQLFIIYFFTIINLQSNW